MKDLAKVLLLSATMLTSVSAGNSKPTSNEATFIPPAMIELDLKDWEWMNMNFTGQFHIDVKYSIGNGKEIIAHYQAMNKTGKWYTLNGSYEVESAGTKQ